MPLERAPELEQLHRDMEDAYRRGDVEAIREMTSTHEATAARGTAPDEIGRGRDEITRLVGQSAEGAPGMKTSSVEAYASGDVGFIYSDSAFVLPDGGEIPCRLLAVAQREDGAWRMVSVLTSIPVPNELLEGDSAFVTHAGSARS
jgi:ketosteroid isomerase-like protein